MKLFVHTPHPHRPVNVNEVHKGEQQSINARIAVLLTRCVGTMFCAYVFALIGIGGLVGAMTGNAFLALVFGSVSSYFLQLVLLPVIMVGQNTLNRKQELQVDEQYQFVMKSYHDIEQICEHLSRQDDELAVQSKMLAELLRNQRKSND